MTKHAQYFNENTFLSNYWTANTLTVIGINLDAQRMLILITDNTKYAQHFNENNFSTNYWTANTLTNDNRNEI